MSTSRISTCLWFDHRVEEAVAFYTALIPNSRVLEVQRAVKGLPHHRAGDVLTLRFTLDGVEYVALNGSEHYRLTPAVSIVLECGDQAEVDRLWAALSEGGEESRCGWLVDRFGLSWQVVPRAVLGMIQDPDPVAAQRAFAALLSMGRIDIAMIERAHRGEPA